MDMETLSLAKGYTNKTVVGMGIQKGANATISNTEEVEGGNNITFEWTGSDGSKEDTTIFVKDGISPTIVENEGNVENEIYKLDITDKDRTFTTPNLYGSSGSGGASTAKDVSYDNSKSGLEGDNVQTALDYTGAVIDSFNETFGEIYESYKNTENKINSVTEETSSRIPSIVKYIKLTAKNRSGNCLALSEIQFSNNSEDEDESEIFVYNNASIESNKNSYGGEDLENLINNLTTDTYTTTEMTDDPDDMVINTITLSDDNLLDLSVYNKVSLYNAENVWSFRERIPNYIKVEVSDDGINYNAIAEDFDTYDLWNLNPTEVLVSFDFSDRIGKITQVKLSKNDNNLLKNEIDGLCLSNIEATNIKYDTLYSSKDFTNVQDAIDSIVGTDIKITYKVTPNLEITSDEYVDLRMYMNGVLKDEIIGNYGYKVFHGLVIDRNFGFQIKSNSNDIVYNGTHYSDGESIVTFGYDDKHFEFNAEDTGDSRTHTDPLFSKVESLDESETENELKYLKIDNKEYKVSAVSEDIKQSVDNINVYVDETTGKLHFVDGAGADSELPFKNIKVYHSTQNTNKFYVSDRTEKPKYLACYQKAGQSGLVFDTDYYDNKYRKYGDTSWITLPTNTTTNGTLGYDSKGMYVYHGTPTYWFDCIAIYED